MITIHGITLDDNPSEHEIAKALNAAFEKGMSNGTIIGRDEGYREGYIARDEYLKTMEKLA